MTGWFVMMGLLVSGYMVGEGLTKIAKAIGDLANVILASREIR
jgi:hypothetical protein